MEKDNLPPLPNVQPAVMVPSADLISFRFDQQDIALRDLKKEAKENFDMLNHKLDYMVTTFTTKAESLEVQSMNEKEHARIWAAIKDNRVSFRFWVTTAVAAIGVVAAIIYTLSQVVT